MGATLRQKWQSWKVPMGDREFFRHLHRMSRLSRAMNAPLDAWEADVLRRTRERYGEASARAVRVLLDEAYIELVTTLDSGIKN
jgi:hypothetical protein